MKTTFHSRMPKALPRAHFKPSWRGDRPAAILATARGRKPAIDCNFQWAGSHAWCIHWTTPLLNNYRYLKTGPNKVRRMTARELRRPAADWGNLVGAWRRGPKQGSARPMTYDYMVHYAKRHGVILVAELKSPAFGTAKAANYMVDCARRANHPPWVMSLLNMKNVRGKAQAISNAGGQFALIFGTFKKLAKKPPKDWREWDQFVTQVWGARWGTK